DLYTSGAAILGPGMVQNFVRGHRSRREGEILQPAANVHRDILGSYVVQAARPLAVPGIGCLGQVELADVVRHGARGRGAGEILDGPDDMDVP
ncbi:hypothetical protein D1G25_15195, partial [Staphylococcus aureus]